jgi:hypothetical protein
MIFTPEKRLEPGEVRGGRASKDDRTLFIAIELSRRPCFDQAVLATL